MGRKNCKSYTNSAPNKLEKTSLKSCSKLYEWQLPKLKIYKLDSNMLHFSKKMQNLKTRNFEFQNKATSKKIPQDPLNFLEDGSKTTWEKHFQQEEKYMDCCVLLAGRKCRFFVVAIRKLLSWCLTFWMMEISCLFYCCDVKYSIFSRSWIFFIFYLFRDGDFSSTACKISLPWNYWFIL